jgi:polyferredoxin
MKQTFKVLTVLVLLFSPAYVLISYLYLLRYLLSDTNLNGNNLSDIFIGLSLTAFSAAFIVAAIVVPATIIGNLTCSDNKKAENHL